MRSKLLFIFLATVATGFIILPSAVSLLTGQHYWYDLSSYDNDVPCEKCHADVAAEMEAHIGPHSGETSILSSSGTYRIPMGKFKCEYCHRWYYTGYTHASVNESSVTTGVESHAASSVACIACHKGDILDQPDEGSVGWGIARFRTGGSYHWDYCKEDQSCVKDGCHDDPDDNDWMAHGNSLAGVDDQGIIDGHCKRCHCGLRNPDDPLDPDKQEPFHSPAAGGFGLTYFSWDTGSMEAHMPLINESRENPTLKDENEACIACHTATAVRINWTHSRSIEFDIGLIRSSRITTDYGSHNWTASNWNVNGTANATVWGNTTGDANTTYGSIEWQGEVPGVNYRYE